MRSVLAGLRTMVLPWGAGPDDPAIVIGPTIPPEVEAHYAAQDLDVIGIIINRKDGENYSFTALLDATPAYVNYPAFLSVTGSVFQGVVQTDSYTIYSFDADRILMGVGTGANIDTIFIGSAVTGINVLKDTGEISALADDIFLTAAVDVTLNAQNDVVVSGTTIALDGVDLTWNGRSMVDVVSWTPTWTSVGGGFSLGNGTVLGRSIKVGEMAYVIARLTIGTTTTLGTGALGTTNLPFDPVVTNQMIQGIVIDSSSGAQRPCSALLSTSGSGSIAALFDDQSGATVNDTSPIAYANGDVYQVGGWYVA